MGDSSSTGVVGRAQTAFKELDKPACAKNTAKVAGVALLALALTAAIFATLMQFNVVSAGAPFSMLSLLTPFGTGVAVTATAAAAIALVYFKRDTVKAGFDKLPCRASSEAVSLDSDGHGTAPRNGGGCSVI